MIKKMIVLVLTVIMVLGNISTSAKEITLPIPKISIKTIDDGTGVKVTINKTTDAEGFEVYATGSTISYADYNDVENDSIKVAEITKDGKTKRTVIIKSLPAGTYKIKVRSFNTKKFGKKTYSSFSKEKTVKLKEAANGYSSSYDFSKVKKGDVIKFGAYEQDGDPANGKEAIEWIVLDKTKKQILVLSKYVLDCLQYNKENKSVTWEDCTLRKWLNNRFYNNAFNKIEKGMIKLTTVENFDNVECETEAGNDTKDKVFILSQLEMINTDYGFADDYYDEDENRVCAATVYAQAQGVETSWYEIADGEYSCSWWLRTPGLSRFNLGTNMYTVYYCAVDVDEEGYVSYLGSLVDSGWLGVRPAMWIDLKSK